MSVKSNEITSVSVDFENDDKDGSRNSSRNSMIDEINSHYSYTDSDLHEFQKMERDIYGSHCDDESSQEHDMMQEFVEEVTDEQTESLEFVRPHVPVRPSLGNPIDTYDEIRSHYEQVNGINQDNGTVETPTEEKAKSKFNIIQSITSPTHKSRGSSRGSAASAETVLSQNMPTESSPSIVTQERQHLNHRPQLSSISSLDSLEKPAQKQVSNRTKLRTLLDQEKATRKSQETYIEHLQQSLNQLLSQHALAKETIDQLRLGIVLNIEENHSRPKLRRERYQKHPSTTNNSQIISRRYSSILGNGDVPEYMNKSNITSRAKSVDMNIFDELSGDINNRNNQKSPDEYGGSLKYVKNRSPINQGLSREIANDFQLNFDKFQTRIEIIEQAIEELSMYIDGGASGSSGSQYGDLDGSNDRLQRDTENRLQNILLAYENLNKDFGQVSQVWKDTAKNYMPANKIMHNMDATEQIEGSLFQLRMQLDDLERHVNQNRPFLSNSHTSASVNNEDRKQELVKRLATLEDNYRQLLGRYHDLKRLSSPSRQKDMEEVVNQLQNIVIEANGRSSIIATPELFENMLHQDLIDSMKRHLTSDSPPYFLTEDGHSSTNSSFGKGRSKRKSKLDLSNSSINGSCEEGHHSGDSTDWKHIEPEPQSSRSKSRTSPRSIEVKTNRSPINHTRPYDSQPVSLVSSTSGNQGATSGETLLKDERGLFKEPFRRSANSLNDMFLRPTNPVETPKRSRNLGNSVDLESSRSRPNSSRLQNLDEDVKRLDEHLARIELEEKNRSSEPINNRDSDYQGSRNTRSLLGTSPSDSNFSRHSKPTSSVGSGHDSSSRNRKSKNKPKQKDLRRKHSAYKLPLESTDSGEESASDEDDYVEDYVRGASCGIGPRSRYVRRKSNSVQDRWSQTPRSTHHKSSRTGHYEQNLSPYDDPYIDDVAYWDGVAFHPAREGLPGKSILRHSSPRAKRRRKHLYEETIPRRPLSDSFSRPPFPTLSRIPYSVDPSLREYSTIGPHRYFVREYGHLNRLYPNHQPMYEEYDDNDEEDEYYRKCVEERRLCNYLDEAIRAARDMKQYTRRLSNICEERQYGRNDYSSYHDRGFRPLYT